MDSMGGYTGILLDWVVRIRVHTRGLGIRVPGFM